MKKNSYLKIFSGIFLFVIVLLLLNKVAVEPWIGRKIETKFNEKAQDYILKIGNLHFTLIGPMIELDSISLFSVAQKKGVPELKGEIAFIKLKGINLTKILFHQDIDIGEVVISNTNLKGEIKFLEKTRPAIISTINLRIDSILFDNIDLAIQNKSNAGAYYVNKGILKLLGLQIEKQDTLKANIVKQLDFVADEFNSVSADSMYTFKTNGVVCSSTSKRLIIDRLSVQPNYKDSEFSARHEFAIDRFEAVFKNIFVRDFSPSLYINSSKLISSYVEIGNMEMDVFRDTRKKIHHVKKAAFQDMIYNFPGDISIDSIGILSGNIIYTEHAKMATEAGTISFNELNAKLYKITNDTIFKTEKAYLKLNAQGRLMNKSRINISLKSRLFDPNNTFSLSGSLSGMNVDILNPMLEKNAFIYARAGKIDKMNFSFTADNARASGKMILLYHGLNIAVKNKRTDDTTALKERVTSIIANIIILDSNPLPTKGVREGIIDYKRDPERFVFNYCAKSILSGIKSSLIKSPKK